MKRLIFTLAVLFPVLASQPLLAQKFKKPLHDRIFNFGVQGGLLVNNLSTRISDFSNDNYLGVQGGLFGRFNIRRFYVQPELNFVMIGGRLNNQYNAGYGVRINGLQFPVMIGVRAISLGLFNMRLNVGGFITGHLTREATFNDPNYPANNAFDGSNIRSYNAGFIAGLGADVWHFTFDIRYNWGLTDLLNDGSRMVQDPEAKLKNGYWQFTLGYKIF